MGNPLNQISTASPNNSVSLRSSDAVEPIALTIASNSGSAKIGWISNVILSYSLSLVQIPSVSLTHLLSSIIVFVPDGDPRYDTIFLFAGVVGVERLVEEIPAGRHGIIGYVGVEGIVVLDLPGTDQKKPGSRGSSCARAVPLSGLHPVHRIHCRQKEPPESRAVAIN